MAYHTHLKTILFAKCLTLKEQDEPKSDQCFTTLMEYCDGHVSSIIISRMSTLLSRTAQKFDNRRCNVKQGDGQLQKGYGPSLNFESPKV